MIRRSVIVGGCLICLSSITVYAMQQRLPASQNRFCFYARTALNSPFTYDCVALGTLGWLYGNRSMISWDNAYKLAFVSFACRMLLPEELSSFFVDIPLIRHIPGYRNSAGENISHVGLFHRTGSLYATQRVLSRVPIINFVAPDSELIRAMPEQEDR